MSAVDTIHARYLLRMQRVVDHIHRHLDGDLGLDVLSGVAAFSPYHFHRQFSAMFGMSLHRYVQMARMKRAAARLAFRADTVTDIAFDAGYEAPDSLPALFASVWARHHWLFGNNRTGRHGKRQWCRYPGQGAKS